MAKRKKKDAACELVAYRFYGIPSELDAAQEDKTFGCCRYLWNRMLGDHNTLYAVKCYTNVVTVVANKI